MKTTTKRLFLMIIVLCTFVHTNSIATKWIVNVQNFSFSPSSLPSVYLGDTVRWVWISGSHTTTNTVIPASAPTWDNPINVSNQFFEYIPTLSGTYNYKCTPHEGMGMIGSFIVSPLPFISLHLNVFLEGPFNGTGMNTDINTDGLIPLAQPYSGVPWNYTGTETVPSIPNASIVDWVLVELRETTGDASTATADKQIHRQAAFVLSDGSVVGLDGSSLITYTGTIANNLYVVIWHRNHLAVMSSGALTEVGGDYAWDFSTGLSKAYLNGQKQLVTGIYGMIGGDSDASGIVLIEDLIPGWSSVAGETGYIPVDLNLDGQASNPDKNDIWINNEGSTAPLLLKCGNPFIDARDGQSYNTVLIGAQCWMAEDLNIGTMVPATTEMTNNLIIEKYCYTNNTANCDVYGGLYQWDEMMQYLTTPGVQGLCPADWHLPADSEWTTLTDFLGGSSVAGGKLKETGTTHWNSPNTGATNESGFTALPGGARYYNSEFNYQGILARYWSSSDVGGFTAWFREMNYNSTILASYDYSKVYGFSVRCVKD